MDVRVVDHPLAAARLTTLRDERTDNAAFRAALRDLTLMLVYEATRDAACEAVSVRTPLAEATGSRFGQTTAARPGAARRAGHGGPGSRVDPGGPRRVRRGRPRRGNPSAHTVFGVVARRPERAAGDGP